MKEKMNKVYHLQYHVIEHKNDKSQTVYLLSGQLLGLSLL